MFITAKDTENDLLTGFNLGADDYISKPFSIREVTARIKAVLRRAQASMETENNGFIHFGELTIDTNKKKATLNEKEITLTKKEFEILVLLVSNPGRVYSREDILAIVWTDEVCVLDRTVDVNITRLRKKLGDFGKNITTRLGYGYCIEQN